MPKPSKPPVASAKFTFAAIGKRAAIAKGDCSFGVSANWPSKADAAATGQFTVTFTVSATSRP